MPKSASSFWSKFNQGLSQRVLSASGQHLFPTRELLTHQSFFFSSDQRNVTAHLLFEKLSFLEFQMKHTCCSQVTCKAVWLLQTTTKNFPAFLGLGKEPFPALKSLMMTHLEPPLPLTRELSDNTANDERNNPSCCLRQQQQANCHQYLGQSVTAEPR